MNESDIRGERHRSLVVEIIRSVGVVISQRLSFPLPGLFGRFDQWTTLTILSRLATSKLRVHDFIVLRTCSRSKGLRRKRAAHAIQR